MIRVAVTGLGTMGKTHIGVFTTIPGVEIAALCDRNLKSLALESLDAGGNIESSGISYDFSDVSRYSDFDEMLIAGGFDAVVLTLPTDIHEAKVIRALDAGYHVFVEKPLALDYESALRIADAAEKSGKVCSVGQCLRFWPLYSEVKKLVDSGELGAVRHAEFNRYSPPPTWTDGGWAVNAARSGNASLDLHIHDVDMILHLFGKPDSVRSVGVPDGQGFFTHISTVYGYRDISVTSTGGWGLAPSFPFNMRALYIFEKATVEMDASKAQPLMVYPVEGSPYPLHLPECDGYRNELVDFLERCEEGVNSEIVNARESAESVRLTRLEILSAREGRELRLEENQ